MYQKTVLVKGNPNKEDLCRIYVRILPMDIRIPTIVRVKSEEFSKGKIIKNRKAKEYNKIITQDRLNAENIIIEALSKGKKITKDLFEKKKGSDFETFVNKHIDLHRGKFSENRIRHLESALEFILRFKPKLTFSDIDIDLLQKFEKHIRSGREDATVLTKMSIFISFLNAAEKRGLIDKKQYSSYKRPAVKQKIPVYLTPDQVNDFHEIVRTVKNPEKKNTGYYFLLSCYTGYRISDCKAFDYNTAVKGNTVIIRAEKNGNIVSSPIYPPLDEILAYCKENPFKEYEQDARETVKAICVDANIPNPKSVKFHSGRHTFAMMWVKKGLSIDKVAQLLGDSLNVARVYARIENLDLQAEMLRLMK